MTQNGVVHPSEYDLSEFHEAVSDLLHYVKYSLPYGSPTMDFQWKIERITQMIKPIEEVIDANRERREMEDRKKYDPLYDEDEGDLDLTIKPKKEFIRGIFVKNVGKVIPKLSLEDE